MDIVSAPPAKMSQIGLVQLAGMAVPPAAEPTPAAGPRLQPWLQHMATPTQSPWLQHGGSQSPVPQHTIHILRQHLHHHMVMALALAPALAVVAPVTPRTPLAHTELVSLLQILESSLGQLVVVLFLSGSRSLSTASVAATTNLLLLSLSISLTQTRM